MWTVSVGLSACLSACLLWWVCLSVYTFIFQPAYILVYLSAGGCLLVNLTETIYQTTCCSQNRWMRERVSAGEWVIFPLSGVYVPSEWIKPCQTLDTCYLYYWQVWNPKINWNYYKTLTYTGKQTAQSSQVSVRNRGEKLRLWREHGKRGLERELWMCFFPYP